MGKKKVKTHYERQEEVVVDDNGEVVDNPDADSTQESQTEDDLITNSDAGQYDPGDIESEPESSHPVTAKVEAEIEAEFLDTVLEYKPPLFRQDSARLKCLLTDTEKQARGKELAEAVLRKHELEQELDGIKKHYATDIKSQDASIDRLQNIVNSGAEFREVSIVINHDYKGGVILSTRIDTGEVFDTRIMTSNERQMSLI